MSEPFVRSTLPRPVEVEAGRTYWWCTCGRSTAQPFCDGSHAGGDARPLAFVAAETTTVWFCGCKRTAKPPLCDGSHKALEQGAAAAR